jgi:putative transcriptional regulator
MPLNPLDYSIKKLNKLTPEKGRLLIAEPFMQDAHFKRSVIYLVEHDKESSVGLVLNKTVGLKLNEVIRDFPKFDAEVYLGGPVQSEHLFYVHTKGALIHGSIPVGDGVFWAGDFRSLKGAIELNLIQPNEIRFFLGYSGWDKGQLESELKGDSWLISNSNHQLLFGDIDADDLWASILKKKGNQYAMMANFPEDPNFN